MLLGGKELWKPANHAVFSALVATNSIDRVGITSMPIEVDVKLLVNGHTVEFEQFFEKWNTAFKELCEKEAKELLSKKLNTDINVLFDHIEDIRKKIVEKADLMEIED
mgnify:CR=1 FL=1